MLRFVPRQATSTGKRRSERSIHSHVQRIKARNSLAGGVNAFTCFKDETPESQGPQSSTTEGPSVAIKDNICTADFPTTCSSKFLKNFNPGYDATVVKLLRNAGCQIIGKTNCDEFGMGSLNVHSVHGPVLNPFQPEADNADWEHRESRSAGGSSGGSAASVQAEMCDAAIGTDTGGSIRLPASYCGVVGLKPSYGMVSRWGVVAFADSLDCVGVLAKNTMQTKRVFDMISRYDPLDPTSIPEDIRTIAKTSQRSISQLLGDESQGSLKGVRIGIPREYFPSELNPSSIHALRRCLHKLKNLGAELVSVSLPSTAYALSAYYVLASAEASSNLARYDGTRFGSQAPSSEADKTVTSNVYAASRSVGFGPEVQRRILLGTYALTADAFDNYFLKAQRLRKLIKDDFNQVFRLPNVLQKDHDPPAMGVDFLVHLSAIRTAPSLAEPPLGIDGYVQDVMTVPASLAGLPAMNVPAGLGNDGWPVGISIVGQWGSDESVLQLGARLESAED